MKTIVLFTSFLCFIEQALCVHNRSADEALNEMLQKVLKIRTGTFDDKTAQQVDKYFMDNIVLNQCYKPREDFFRNLGVTDFFHIAVPLESSYIISLSSILNGEVVPADEEFLQVFIVFHFEPATNQQVVSEETAVKYSFDYLKRLMTKLANYRHQFEEAALFYSPEIYKLRSNSKSDNGNRLFFIQSGIAFKQSSREVAIQHNDENCSARSDYKLEESNEKNKNQEPDEGEEEIQPEQLEENGNGGIETTTEVSEAGVNTASEEKLQPGREENAQNIEIESEKNSNATVKLGSVSNPGSNAIEQENDIPYLTSTQKKKSKRKEEKRKPMDTDDHQHQKSKIPFVVKVGNKVRTSISNTSNLIRQIFNIKSETDNKEVELANKEKQQSEKSNKYMSPKNFNKMFS